MRSLLPSQTSNLPAVKYLDGRIQIRIHIYTHTFTLTHICILRIRRKVFLSRQISGPSLLETLIVVVTLNFLYMDIVIIIGGGGSFPAQIARIFRYFFSQSQCSIDVNESRTNRTRLPFTRLSIRFEKYLSLLLDSRSARVGTVPFLFVYTTIRFDHYLCRHEKSNANRRRNRMGK